MVIDIKGHSGCSVQVRREGHDLFLYKSTQDKAYFERLVLQAEKQKKASEVEYQHIRVPHIFEIKEGKDETFIKMEYVYSKNFIEHFESAGFEQINYFIKAIIWFIDKELAQCSIRTVKHNVILEKFQDVQKKISSNPLCQDEQIKRFLTQSEEIFNKLEDMTMPVGLCHGDLTFSNILFNGNNYYLIDFLDSFIESPLMDIVKIRQDSSYLWSLLMSNISYDNIRLRIIADAIDAKVHQYYNQFPWYKNYYQHLQLMNFLRVLQYAKTPSVITYLKNVLSQLTHAF